VAAPIVIRKNTKEIAKRVVLMFTSLTLSAYDYYNIHGKEP
jgi:hypothetical protein